MRHCLLKVNKTLKKFDIDNNAIDHVACDAITTTLKRNRCLIVLGLHNNLLSNKTILNIVECPEVNNALYMIFRASQLFLEYSGKY